LSIYGSIIDLFKQIVGDLDISHTLPVLQVNSCDVWTYVDSK